MPEPQPAGSRSRLKIAVFGAGSIGCQLGGHLAAVADVTLIGRPAAVAVLEAEGVRLTGGGRTPVHLAAGAVRLATTADAAADADYVLVTVKSPATGEAAAQLAPHLRRDAVVVSFQNGLRNPRVLRTVLTGQPVLAGMVPYNVVQTAPATFHQGTSGVLMIEDRPKATPLAGALERAGLPTRTRRDMHEVHHAKLLMNLNNAINALSGLPLRDQLGQRAYRACLALCQTEALAAFRAGGIRPARLTAVPTVLLPRLLGLPDRIFHRLAASLLDIDDRARSSMWEDVRRGRRTEIDTLQGEIVALAARHECPAPANSHLITLIRRAEAAGPGEARRFTGPELLAELTRLHP